MFTLKRGVAITAAAIILLCAALGFACGSVAAATVESAPVIVIDAGHGGIDAGVRGKQSGVKESEINLAVARQLAGLFRSAGFTAVLTRKTEGGLYGLPTKGFKLRDLNARRDTIENCGADMVISVHQNAFSDPQRRGAQVFFYPDSTDGKALADCIQKCLNQTPFGDDKSALAADYFMLRCTSAPSVVVECGFLSNAQDENLLLSDDGKRQAAYAIFSGAVMFYS